LGIGEVVRWLGRRVRHPVRSLYQAVSRLPEGRLRTRLLGFPSEAALLSRLDEIAGGEEVWIFPAPSCPWGYLFQRPQQFARAVARSGRTTLYCVDATSMLEPDVSVRGLREVEARLYLFNDGLGGRALSRLGNPITVWQYWPHQAAFVRSLPPGRRVVYDVIDHVDVFQPYPDIEKDFRESLESADVALATAKALYEETQQDRPDVLLTPNAVCYQDFAEPQATDWPEVAAIRKESQVLVTYYGALADWVDFDLVKHCAQALPGWTFLMVGYPYPGVIERERPQDTPGIRVLPAAPYERLPWLLKVSDVAIIPFKINDITRNTSPVKLFEYMAAGKPVVTTDLPECRRYEPVAVAGNAEEFVEMLRQAREKADDMKRVERLRSCAQEHTWQARLQGVLEALEDRAR